MKNIILIIVALAMFMEAVDATVINTAIPAMAQSLDVSPIDLKIALISYLISLAIFIPISGWVADKLGTKKVFMSAIVIFTVSSIWCGITHNLSELVLGRIVQGFGGALTMPIGRLIIVRACERHELVSKMSIVVMVSALGLMLGPVLGGFITNHFSWRWIFWINIPVGMVTFILAGFLFPDMPPRPVPKLDIFGFLLFGTGLASLTLGLAIISEHDIHKSFATLIIVLSILLIILYSLHSRKKDYPIVKTDLLKLRTFRTSVIGNLLSRIGFGGVPFLIPLLLQIVLGYSPQLSGMLLAPTAFGVLIVKPLSLPILRFFGYKNFLTLNTLLVGISLLSFACVSSHTSVYAIAFYTFIYGFFVALQFTGMNSLAYANISHENVSAATSIMSTVQQLSQSFGVAISAILISIFTSKANGNQHLLTESIFQHTFITMGFLTLFSSIVFFYMKSEDGHELLEQPA